MVRKTARMLMRASKNEDVRQRSANVILDRAYGKPTQPIGGDEENPLELLMQHLHSCAQVAELHSGLPTQSRSSTFTKPECGARTRKGLPCKRLAYGNGRC